MKPDAMTDISSVLLRLTAQQDRMDRAQGGRQPVQAQGFGADEAAQSKEPRTPAFKTVYEAVADTNAKARAITDANTDSKQSDADPQLQDVEKVVQEPQQQNGQVPAGLQSTSPQESSDQAAENAGACIAQALSAVAVLLDLGEIPEIKGLSVSGPSPEIVQQFSDILSSLKKIVAQFDDAVVKQQSIMLPNGSEITLPQAAELAGQIRTQIFRIEFGVGMLGMGEAVQSGLAQKLDLPFAGDIPQAMNPATVTMPQSLVQKIRELVAMAGQNKDQQPKLTIVAQEADGPGDVKNLMPFDSQVMRKLLKIDSKELIAGQNQVQFADAGTKPSAAQLFTAAEVKTTLPTYRTLDDSVINQIADRLSTAVRSGFNEVRLQLRPESLGDVHVRIRVEGDTVFARIQVESQQVRQIVESNLQHLKDSLSQQHLQAGSLEVSVGSGTWNQHQTDGSSSSPAHGTAASGNFAGNSGAEPESAALALGSETGRRFGDNTIEYFA